MNDRDVTKQDELNSESAAKMNDGGVWKQIKQLYFKSESSTNMNDGVVSNRIELKSESAAKVNDGDLSKQIEQIVMSVRLEADEKANEIAVSAEEELNIEKQKEMIRQEYERKEKLVAVW